MCAVEEGRQRAMLSVEAEDDEAAAGHWPALAVADVSPMVHRLVRDLYTCCIKLW